MGVNNPHFSRRGNKCLQGRPPGTDEGLKLGPGTALKHGVGAELLKVLLSSSKGGLEAKMRPRWEGGRAAVQED